MLEWLTHDAGVWVYVALFALAALDGVFPIVPSESAVISVGVLAAGGDADLALVVLAGGLGALAGDHLAYALGRSVARRTRRRAGLARAQDLLRRRGPSLLIVSRYIPGGRTATTVAAGSARLPLRTFTSVTALAGATWATTSALIGYLGGRAFEDHPLAGIAVGIGVSLVLAGIVELVHRARSTAASAGGAEVVSPPVPAEARPEPLAA